MFKGLKVLVLDDYENTGIEVVNSLKVLLPGVEPTYVKTVRGAIGYLAHGLWDIVILDLNMERDPDFATNRATVEAAGFYAYLFLYNQLCDYPRNLLAPLVVLYSGNEHIKTVMTPFMTHAEAFDTATIYNSVVQRRRPFVIIPKGGTAHMDFKEALMLQERERFASKWQILNTGSEVVKKLEMLAEGTVPAIVSQLGNLEVARGLPVWKVFPVHLSRIRVQDNEARCQLEDTFANQDFLGKLNYMFQVCDDQPSYRLIHGRKEYLGDFEKQLDLVPPKTAKRVLDELGISRDGDFLQIDDETKFLRTADTFKAKWSRWDSDTYTIVSGGSEIDIVETLPGSIVKTISEVALKRQTSVTWQGSNAQDQRLYVDPAPLHDIAISVAENACQHSKHIWVRVVYDKNADLMHLDIADDGRGVRLAGHSFPTYDSWARILRGWGEVQVFSRFNQQVYSWRNGTTAEADWPAFSAEINEMENVGTLVRMSFRSHSYWR